MPLLDSHRHLKDELTALALEPDRVDAWLRHLASCGYAAEVEWRPFDLADTPPCGSFVVLAQIRLDGSAIDCIELVRGGSTNRTGRDGSTVQAVSYQDHFIVEGPGRGPAHRIHARRDARRRFGIFGRAPGYAWRGGDLAVTFAEDRDLNDRLDAAGEGEIHIFYDRGIGSVRIIRHYIGMTALGVRDALVPDDAAAPGGTLRTFGVHGAVSRELHLPTPEALQTYEDIAGRVRELADF